MSTKFYERSCEEWQEADIVKRLQCILSSPVTMYRDDPKVNKTLKDARKEICQLRKELKGLRVRREWLSNTLNDLGDYTSDAGEV